MNHQQLCQTGCRFGLILNLLLSAATVFAEEITPEFFTSRFVVPASFLDFKPKEVPKRFATAQQVLEAAGISFAEGASAVFLTDSSTLIVRNNSPQIQGVESYVTELRKHREFNAMVNVVFVETKEPLWKLPDKALERKESDQKLTPKISMLRSLGAPDIESAIQNSAFVKHHNPVLFSVEQYQNMLLRAKVRGDVKVLVPNHLILAEGETAMANIEDYGVGVTARFAGKGVRNVAMEIFLRQPDSKKRMRAIAKVTTIVPDGKMVAMVDRISSGYLTTFVKADLMSPEGELISDLEGKIPEITERERDVLVLGIGELKKIAEADERTLKAALLLEQGEVDAAKTELDSAGELLPNHPMAKHRRDTLDQLRVQILSTTSASE